jgi:hypothetical protein
MALSTFRSTPRPSTAGAARRKPAYVEQLQAELADAIDQREERRIVDIPAEDCLDGEYLRADLAERSDEGSAEATLDPDLGLRG